MKGNFVKGPLLHSVPEYFNIRNKLNSNKFELNETTHPSLRALSSYYPIIQANVGLPQGTEYGENSWTF